MFCVFVGCLPGITGYHRVSPGITGYHRVSPGITQPGFFHLAGLRRSTLRGRGDVPRLAVPPAHDY